MSALEKIELFDTLFFVSLGIAIVGLIFAVFFFFYFNIPSVFALMTGRSRKNALEQMRERNLEGKSLREKTGTGSLKKQAAAVSGLSGGLSGEITESLSGGLAYDPPKPEQLERPSEETVPLGDAEATTALRSDKPDTTILKPRERTEDAGATEILSRPASSDPAPDDWGFRIRESILLIHTQETI